MADGHYLENRFQTRVSCDEQVKTANIRKNRAYCIGGSDSPTDVHKMYTDLIIRP